MRKTRLSEIWQSLNPGIREDIQQIRDRLEDPVSVPTAAELLHVTERQIHQLCQDTVLDFERRRIRKVYKKSLIIYILKRHGMNHVEVDDDSIRPQERLEYSVK